MKIGTLALGGECIGVVADSEVMDRDELELARRIAREHDFTVRTIRYSELDNKCFAANSPERCYFCKHDLLERLREMARQLGARAVAEGSNMDDEADWRPGLRAVQEMEVISPLREAKLGKSQIRELARALGLPNWDKPANPCLASRIAYGIMIDRRKLDQIDQGERWLRQQGFRVVRLRHHGEQATVEVGADELARLAEPALRRAVIDHIKSLGFKEVQIDPRGYRTGSLNEGIARPGSSS
jgi:uncharacterized protein